MKKLFVVMTALMAVATFATASFAANQVQMTLTSPTIYKAGCEKIGSTTYSFDGNSTITEGDWWYMDLPENVTLCKDYKFIVAGNIAGAYANVTINAAGDYDNASFNFANIACLAASTGTGPITASGNNKTFKVNGGNMAFLVLGSSGSRRIAIYTLTAAGETGATLTVEGDSTFQMKLFDGKAWSETKTATAGKSVILVDSDGDGTYGENETGATIDEVIGGDCDTNSTAGAPYVENTLCVNATSMSGQYLYTSYASKSDKFTFSGDSQIAHTAAASTIALASCKTASTDTITITSGQTTTCAFDYNSGTEIDYCTSGFKNKMLIKATSGAFGDIDDKYYVTAEITSPSDGVYFGGYPSVVAYKSTEDSCLDYTVATAAGSRTQLVGATSGNWSIYQGSTAATGIGDSDCAVASGKMVTKIVQKASYMDLDDYNAIWVWFDDFHYTNAAVAAGEEVTIKLTLNRYPCGEIFTGSRTIGSFVTSCASSTSTTLYFPWLPGTAAAGWWGGYVITNIGTTSGTAALTYSDSDGKTATYTTPAVAAGAQWTAGVTAADLTNVSGFDMSKNHSVTAVCAFSARGFAFTGNGNEGTGYLANGLSGTEAW